MRRKVQPLPTRMEVWNQLQPIRRALRSQMDRLPPTACWLRVDMLPRKNISSTMPVPSSLRFDAASGWMQLYVRRAHENTA